MLNNCADPASSNAGPEAIELQELVRRLRNYDDLGLSPLQSVVDQADSGGSPAGPSEEHVAVLNWLGAAYAHWEMAFPLEQSLSIELRRLKPLLAVLAITDEEFLVPGRHPLHVILDNLQLAAVGWQPQLGRAGLAVQKLLVGTIDAALGWLDDSGTDLAALSTRVVDATARTLERANRMTQRMVETEQGRIRSAEAKRTAAGMINAALERFPSPKLIADFLKGPWYESAQLVLLKFGLESTEWNRMTETTTTLLDSLQPDKSEEGDQRQRLFAIVKQMPKELKRWLLSLQHDSDAIADAMAMVEFAHMQLLRGRKLELEQSELIPLPEMKAPEAAHGKVAEVQTGQWLSVDPGDGERLRMRLALKMKEAEQLIFANLAGLKVSQISYEDFARLIDDGKVTALDCGASFSRSLAHAAGVANADDLRNLEKISTLLAGRREGTQLRLEEERETDRRLQLQREEARRQKQLEDEARESAEDDSGLQLDELEGETPGTAERESGVEPDQLDEPVLPATAEDDSLELDLSDDVISASLARDSGPEPGQPAAGSGLSLAEEAELLMRRSTGETPRQHGESTRQSAQAPGETLARQAASAGRGAAEAADQVQPVAAPPAGTAQHESAAVADGSTPTARSSGDTIASAIELPMGTWLGFHDGETPLLAKLAVHDLENNNYIFVNRSGIKMRQLGSRELFDLMEKGLVDILETRTSFREEILRAKKQLEE